MVDDVEKLRKGIKRIDGGKAVVRSIGFGLLASPAGPGFPTVVGTFAGIHSIASDVIGKKKRRR